MLRIALPNKGRLAEDVRGVFADAGLEIRARGERALTASLGGEFEAIFVRSQDIPELVSDGVADAGVTGWDLVCETGAPGGRRDWTSSSAAAGWCSPRARTRASSGRSSFHPGVRAATVFPRLARAFFAERGLAVDGGPRLRRGRGRPSPRHRRRGGRPHQHRQHAPHQRSQGDLHRCSSPPRASSPGPASRADRAAGAARARGCARLGAPRPGQALPDGQRAARPAARRCARCCPA